MENSIFDQGLTALLNRAFKALDRVLPSTRIVVRAAGSRGVVMTPPSQVEWWEGALPSPAIAPVAVTVPGESSGLAARLGRPKTGERPRLGRWAKMEPVTASVTPDATPTPNTNTVTVVALEGGRVRSTRKGARRGFTAPSGASKPKAVRHSAAVAAKVAAFRASNNTTPNTVTKTVKLRDLAGVAAKAAAEFHEFCAKGYRAVKDKTARRATWAALKEAATNAWRAMLPSSVTPANVGGKA